MCCNTPRHQGHMHSLTNYWRGMIRWLGYHGNAAAGRPEARLLLMTSSTRSTYLIQCQSFTLSPDDASLPQGIDDGIVYDGVRLAALLTHEVVGSQGSPPLPALLICADERCEGDHIWYATLLLHLLKQLCCTVALRTCMWRKHMCAAQKRS